MAGINRRAFLRSLGGSAVAASLLPWSGCASWETGGPAGQRPPNVVLMVADDQGYGDFACYDNPILKTPNLDQLFSESTRLTNFYVAPLCAPTRASLMTGRYNYRTGVWDTWMGRTDMHADEVCIAECFAEAGYRTGIFGKWHVGFSHPKRPQDLGFHDTLRWIDPVGGRFDPLMSVNGEEKRLEGFIDDILCEGALQFIEANQDRPFFCYLPSFMPHDGTYPQVPEAYVEPYADAPGLKQGDKEVYAMVAKFDENVGRVLRRLRELGLEDNTIVIYLSDNGPLRLCPELVSMPEILACEAHDMGNRYNAGLRGGKTNVYEGGVRTPCFVRWPGRVPAGRDLADVAAHIDLMPTLLAWCGVAPPAGVHLDGIDLSGRLTGRDAVEADRMVFMQSDRVETPRLWHNCMVRHGRWKLVDGVELYDLQADPGETTNVAADRPDVVRRLRAAYQAWFQDVSSGRGFVPSYSTVGSPLQLRTRFHIYHHHSTGWPLDVVAAGPYRIALEGIQADLFPQGGRFVLTIGDVQLNAPIEPGRAQVVFEDVMLPTGRVTMDIRPEGEKLPKKMYYGNEDFGYREIVIDRIMQP